MLRILVITLLAMLLLRMVYRAFFHTPRNISSFAKDGYSKKKPGDVTVEDKSDTKSKYDKDEGEVIDYEDVKD